MLIIAIIGGRTRTVSDEEIISHLPFPVSSIDGIVSGGASGVDKCAAAFARRHNIHFTEVKPDYTAGRQAPLLRNRTIVMSSSFVLAFPARKSPGTWHAIGEAKKAGIEVKIVPDGFKQLSLF